MKSYKSNPAKSCGCDHVSYFFQGGGALGSYQVGVFAGLREAGYEPNWLVGTSIGAINAAIIAGNKPKDAINQLKSFWDMLAQPIMSLPFSDNDIHIRRLQNFWSAYITSFTGEPGFFTPKIIDHPFYITNSTPDKISFYDWSDLKTTLEKFIDFDLINKKLIRLSLCAIEVESGQLVIFDNAKEKITADHVMASCALPPGFPAVKINDKYYWDGGMNASTPMQLFLENSMGKSCLCFSMQLFDSYGLLPTSLDDVLKRKKDITFASQYRRSIQTFRDMHNLKRALGKLLDELPDNQKNNTYFRSICKIAHSSQLNFVRFHYKARPIDLSSKDYEFSQQSVTEHMDNGYSDAKSALKNPPWLKPIPENIGIVVHEVSDVPVHEEHKHL